MYTIYDDDEGKYQLVEEPDPSVTYTYADYMSWKFKERLELFRGKIFKMGAPNTLHQVVGGILYNELYNYLKGKVCRAFVAPFDIRLPMKNRKKDNEITTVVQPDVCVVCNTAKVDSRGVCGAPDLVIEILSPGNSKKELRDKYELYEEAGVREYWVINPTEENLVVFLLGQEGKFGAAKVYTGGDRLTAVTVPGFGIDVDEIFAQ
ncbi:MAG TPA: Uma2 family endonuclease [Puia sp.]|nr:Uma2 family endonuclease [Puia sp.]